MAGIPFTPDQQRAIQTTDNSIVVTAAAGSGKTAVLAARCAYLVCDLPGEQQCSMDELLVVTFTDAAAAEMRERITSVIRKRLNSNPQDLRLREQLALMPAAQISTIHSFCRWIIQRWFNLADIEPSPTLLDGEQSTLLKLNVLNEGFLRLYEADTEVAKRLKHLVDIYGMGRDERIAEQVLQIANFVDSLAEPDEWLSRATDYERNFSYWFEYLLSVLQQEKRECQRIVSRILTDWPAGSFLVDPIEDHQRSLTTWISGLKNQQFDEVSRAISDTRISFRGGPQVKTGKTPDDVAYEINSARHAFNKMKDQFNKQIPPLFAGFTRDELQADLKKVHPFALTIIDLVQDFRHNYTQAKRGMGVVDFNDLERHAYTLISQKEEVSKSLRNRFMHVLVDEFQDVSPLQDAILRAVSREDDPDRPNNLFVVGDVKQSIYQFRLAEPELLLNREASGELHDHQITTIRLRENFRSRACVIDGVNALFQRLMIPETGGVDYRQQILRCGRSDSYAKENNPIELHLLEKNLSEKGNRSDEESDSEMEGSASPDMTDPHMRETCEREAHLIGTRIQQMLDTGATTDDGRPLEYRDITILLRSTRHTAGPMAEVLNGMGIPTYTNARESLLDTLEIRDVLSLLSILDNFQQDIPLASVLRAGLLGDFSEDDLTIMRLEHPRIPFHQCVRDYAQAGEQQELKERVASFLSSIESLRRAAREQPLPEVLWLLYIETQLPARVSALPGGAQRYANLIRLHERARQFNTFEHQGLHRFISFLAQVEESDTRLDSASIASASENVVRIMTIHNSKGLEFPVVFLAGLGRRFNLRDAYDRILFERKTGLGLRAVDKEKMIEYPTISHRLAEYTIKRSAKEEELRILYVALTRARDRLLLVGSGTLKSLFETRDIWSGHPDALPAASILGVSAPLDWIFLAMAAHGAGQINWPDSPQSQTALATIYTWDKDTIGSWEIAHTALQHSTPDQEKASQLLPLPPNEPVSESLDDTMRLLNQLDTPCESDTASSIRAVVAASEVKHTLDPLTSPEERPRSNLLQVTQFDIPSLRDQLVLSPSQRGTATHTFLQHLQIEHVGTQEGLSRELDRLLETNVLSQAESDAIELESISWFFQDSRLGRLIRENPDFLNREVMFLSTEQADRFDPTVAGAQIDIPVIVRGVVDGVLNTPDGLIIFDYKTDRISADQLDERVRHYSEQMKLYASAVSRSYGKPVLQQILVFLYLQVETEVSIET